MSIESSAIPGPGSESGKIFRAKLIELNQTLIDVQRVVPAGFEAVVRTPVFREKTPEFAAHVEELRARIARWLEQAGIASANPPSGITRWKKDPQNRRKMYAEHIRTVALVYRHVAELNGAMNHEANLSLQPGLDDRLFQRLGRIREALREVLDYVHEAQAVAVPAGGEPILQTTNLAKFDWGTVFMTKEEKEAAKKKVSSKKPRPVPQRQRVIAPPNAGLSNEARRGLRESVVERVSLLERDKNRGELLDYTMLEAEFRVRYATFLGRFKGEERMIIEEAFVKRCAWLHKTLLFWNHLTRLFSRLKCVQERWVIKTHEFQGYYLFRVRPEDEEEDARFVLENFETITSGFSFNEGVVTAPDDKETELVILTQHGVMRDLKRVPKALLTEPE